MFSAIGCSSLRVVLRSAGGLADYILLPVTGCSAGQENGGIVGAYQVTVTSQATVT